MTVGTHEQQFDRLVEYMDKWAENHKEEVVIQTGYSTYVPQNATWKAFFSYDEMIYNISIARIVITHGGPSSFIMATQAGKSPIVVPRRKEYGEHVNNHQVDFLNSAKQHLDIIVVNEIDKLAGIIQDKSKNMMQTKEGIKQNNEFFCYRLEKIINELMK